jgi:hypothetical protein
MLLTQQRLEQLQGFQELLSAMVTRLDVNSHNRSATTSKLLTAALLLAIGE